MASPHTDIFTMSSTSANIPRRTSRSFFSPFAHKTDLTSSIHLMFPVTSMIVSGAIICNFFHLNIFCIFVFECNARNISNPTTEVVIQNRLVVLALSPAHQGVCTVSLKFIG